MDEETKSRCITCVQQLTVFFEEPYWIGVFERISEGELSACRIVFGAEPRDFQVQAFILKNYNRLCFSPAVAADAVKNNHNPKRVQREVRRQTCQRGIATKSQQVLKLQQEQFKAERKSKRTQRKETEKQHKFELKQQKRKEKHRGR